MSIRVIPDENQPSASIELPLEKPLPEYHIEQVEQPTPREVDAILGCEGFRELIDDARGVLMELLAHPPAGVHSHDADLEFTHPVSPCERSQVARPIGPGDDQVYRPVLWIVVYGHPAKPKATLS